MTTLWHHHVYRRLLAAQVVGLLGAGILTVALGLLAYDLAGTRAGAVLGTALAIKMLAYVFVAPVATVLADRVPVKTVLIGADVVRALVALSLPWVGEVWQVYLLVFLLQSASAVFTPTFQATIPAVLPDEADYTRALSLSRLAYDLESVVSPIIAGALLLVMSFHGLFLGTVAGFVGSAVLVLVTALPVREQGPPEQGGWARSTLGVRIFRVTPSLRFLMALNLTVGAGTALVMVNTVVYVRAVLSMPASGVAVALACFGAGSVSAALAVPRMVERFGDRTLMLVGGGLVVLGLTAAVVLTAANDAGGAGWWLLLVIWVVLGAGGSLVETPAARLLLRASTPQSRGAVYTAQFSLSHACFLLTYPIAGWVGATSLTAAALVLAILAGLGLVLALRTWPGVVPPVVD